MIEIAVESKINSVDFHQNEDSLGRVNIISIKIEGTEEGAAGKCEPCPTGMVSEAGSSACSSCPAGT